MRGGGDECQSVHPGASLPLATGRRPGGYALCDSCRGGRQRFSYVERLSMIKKAEENYFLCGSPKNQFSSADTGKIVILEGSEYQISAATFPTYFLKDLSEAAETHIRLDLDLFQRHIAPALKAEVRFVGTERKFPDSNLFRHRPCGLRWTGAVSGRHRPCARKALGLICWPIWLAVPCSWNWTRPANPASLGPIPTVRTGTWTIVPCRRGWPPFGLFGPGWPRLLRPKSFASWASRPNRP